MSPSAPGNTNRTVSPERRVLSGASMLVRYHEDDQSPEMAQFNRELFEFEMLTPEEKEGLLQPKGPDGQRILRLRVDLTSVATRRARYDPLGARCR